MFLSASPKATSPSFAAACSAAESVGHFVVVSGAGPTVTAIDIDASPIQVPDGIIISKPTSTTCIVQTAGVVVLAGVVAGLRYFIGSGAFAQAGPPTAPGSGKRAIHFVGVGRNTNQLSLKFSPPTIVIS
jgi:hypothetical protein